LNQTRSKPTRPKRVTPSGTWYKTTLKEERQRIISAAQDKYRMPDRGSNLFYNNGVTDVISIVDPEA
jgi:hypothetical protein